MAFLGGLVGSFFGIFVLAIVWEWVLFKRILDDPLKGKLLSVGVAWLTMGTVAGWTMADGGPYYWGAFTLYIPAAVVLAFLAYRRGLRLRTQQHDPDIAEVFD